MEIYPSKQQFRNNQAADSLLAALETRESELALEDAALYSNFPLYRDDEGGVLVADAMLLSRRHGVICFLMTEATRGSIEEQVSQHADTADHLTSHVYSRLIKNKGLRENSTQLSFAVSSAVYAPFSDGHKVTLEGCSVLTSVESLHSYLLDFADQELAGETFAELVSAIDGAKGLVRPRKRTLLSGNAHSKGAQAARVEAEITNFDQQQKHGIMGSIEGPQRIRGLAGSGKTVVLAMKAAQMHLQHPDARIAFTFNTKSLYQHVKRLITRFYRQFDDRDPGWDSQLFILHGWGGASAPGIYSTACEQHGVSPLSLRQAAASGASDKFDYACSQLAASASIQPIYDYIFIDEGQDFPLSFIRLCNKLAVDGKFVLAYDELQSLFQATAPTTADVFGVDASGKPSGAFTDDAVLHKCYRNPREIIVCAHAIGFGVYGPKIVQLPENQAHWEDIGYKIVAGELEEGSSVEVDRPEENSLTAISESSGIEEIVKCKAFDGWDEEIQYVIEGIAGDIADDLRPEDVLVVSIDDRNARQYFTDIEKGLSERGIICNNLASDTFGLQEFTKDSRVTLSTVYKAKGNEAFVVYVVGVDAAASNPDIRKRNKIFTAMTRAKGWVRITGIGEHAQGFAKELGIVKSKFPKIVFDYPSEEFLTLMKRDLAEAANKKQKVRRLLDQLGDDFTVEEIEQLLKEEQARKRKPKRGGR